MERVEKILKEAGLPYDKEVEAESFRIDVEDGTVWFDECGRMAEKTRIILDVPEINKDTIVRGGGDGV
jgi:aspartate-semialdehyde dehydrogenase